MTTMAPLLQIEELTVRFDGLTAVDNVSLTVGQGETKTADFNFSPKA